MNCKVIAKGALTLLTKRFAGPFWIRRRWLNKTQWISLSELQEIQIRLLKKLIRHCYNSVPFYRKIMDERAIKVESIRSLENIKQFPILTKQQVLTAGDSIISTKYPRWLMSKGRTGGTTGTPLVTPRNLFSLGNEHAFVRRQFDWAGIGSGDRTAYLSGRFIVHPDNTNGTLYAYDPFMKELILSTYHLSAETAKRYAQAMNRYGVKAIVGYPASIYFLAKVCLDSGIKVKLNAALTTSETLTDVMRTTIAEAFDCRVFDFYGAAERVCYIYTCESGSYHLILEYGYAELIPQNSTNENECNLVATGFWNFGMPLIRYDIGDIVIKSNKTCSCGRVFPVIDSIIGRKGDVIKTPSGKSYGPTLMARVAKGANNILESQIIQDAIDRITILYVPGEKFTAKDLADFKQHLNHYMPGELEITLKQVKAIDRTGSGKFKFIVSQL
jgi:phenylacetate-CoA ligase